MQRGAHLSTIFASTPRIVLLILHPDTSVQVLLTRAPVPDIATNLCTSPEILYGPIAISAFCVGHERYCHDTTTPGPSADEEIEAYLFGDVLGTLRIYNRSMPSPSDDEAAHFNKGDLTNVKVTSLGATASGMLFDLTAHVDRYDSLFFPGGRDVGRCIILKFCRQERKFLEWVMREWTVGFIQ